jgi:hypothetical protein
MLNPTYEPSHEAPEPVIFFPGEWFLPNLDLWNKILIGMKDFSTKKWPNFVRFQNPQKKQKKTKKKSKFLLDFCDKFQ